MTGFILSAILVAWCSLGVWALSMDLETNVKGTPFWKNPYRYVLVAWFTIMLGVLLNQFTGPSSGSAGEAGAACHNAEQLNNIEKRGKK